MFDTYTPFLKIQKQPFIFDAHHYEIWMLGKLIDSGKVSCQLECSVIFTIDFIQKCKLVIASNMIDVNRVNYEKLLLEIDHSILFDEMISLKDRLQLITIPLTTNTSCIGLVAYKSMNIHTCSHKDFAPREPYCCNIFTLNGLVELISFSFSNPEKLIKFYSREAYKMEYSQK